MDAIVMKKANELAGQTTTLEALNGVMRSLMKAALERMLNTELEVHQGRVTTNRLLILMRTVPRKVRPSLML